MADTETEEGPKVVWTFPLARQFQSDRGILQLGTRLGNVISSGGMVGGSGPVRERVQERRNSDNNTSGDDSSSTEDSTSSIEEDIQELSENRETVFDSESASIAGDGKAMVDVEDGVFIPTKVNIQPGETVVWENADDEVHRVVGAEGEEFDSGQLEPGETYEHTFDEEKATIYIDSMSGGGSMSGAVIVGDAELEEPLPSSGGEDPVPFEEDTETDSGLRTMSEAADEKEEMELGFSD
jgi:plastocyanin